MSDMDQLIREDARLIILKALRDQTDERLNSSLLLEIIETFGGIRKTREWLHGELDWLAEMGAIKLNTAGSVKIATLTEKGAHHLERRIIIEGIKRPSRPGA
ncbi:MAG: hypothetical protein CFE33_15130 [Pseudorhodobacter sp. PARRP1]|nr:MAG: hypothetical protein CFE33_15130 [Pseudorhodobacter sp. PARRP1]